MFREGLRGAFPRAHGAAIEGLSPLSTAREVTIFKKGLTPAFTHDNEKPESSYEKSVG